VVSLSSTSPLWAYIHSLGENTKIALPETKLGIIPGAGGTQRLTGIVGVAKAKELIFTGRRIDGVEAERIGGCDFLVKTDI
jgi:methylglutaconyl-CoA hydratase